MVKPPAGQTSTVFGIPGTARTGTGDGPAAANAGAATEAVDALDALDPTDAAATEAADAAATSVVAPTARTATVFTNTLMRTQSPSRSRFRANLAVAGGDVTRSG
jgi:hypothetical protein